MNKMKKYVYASLFFAFLGCKSVQKVSDAQTPTQSKTEENNTPKTASIFAIHSNYQLIDSSNVRIFMQVTLSDFVVDETALQRFTTQFRVNWNVVTDYATKEKVKSGRVDKESIRFDNQKCYITYDIPRIKGLSEGVLISEFIDLQASKKFTSDFPIDFNGTRLQHRFGLYRALDNGRPAFQNYLITNEKIEFKAINGQEKELFLLQFEQDETAAASPMSTKKQIDLQSKKPVRAVQKIKTNTPLDFQETGFYYALEDSTDWSNGVGFLVVDERFPRFTFPEKLLKPTVYISTSTETEKNKRETDAKKAMDELFLTFTKGNEALSQKIIQHYYQRVSEANRLFTNVKEGWQTDRGMVYIVLGPPSRIQRFKDREVWLYSQSENFSEIIFTFYKKNNQFTEEYYELVRYPDYNQYWYPYVEAWRNGKIIE